MVSADTLVYFGDLLEFCEAAASALRPSGLLVFTLEHAVGGDISTTGWNYTVATVTVSRT